MKTHKVLPKNIKFIHDGIKCTVNPTTYEVTINKKKFDFSKLGFNFKRATEKAIATAFK